MSQLSYTKLALILKSIFMIYMIVYFKTTIVNVVRTLKIVRISIFGNQSYHIQSETVIMTDEMQ